MDPRWNSTGSVATNSMNEAEYRRGEEYYIGDGQANVIKTSANQVARLITDKDLLDTIFAVVEPDKYGRVPTSKLLSLVRETYHGDHDELEMALDPMGLDMAIDLETFKSVVFNWEDKQATQDLFIPETTSTPNTSPKSSCKLNSSFDFDELNFLHISSSADDKMDRYTLENEISQLKYNNSKLKSENTELENQLSNLDVLFGNLQHDCENLRHKNQNLENQLQTIQKELDSCMSKFAEENNKWDKEKTYLINERKDLERQVKNLKDELNEMIKDLTNLRNSEEVLKNSFFEHEFSFVQAVNEKEALEERVTQLGNHCDEFRERLVETLRNNEHVRKMRHELEEEVCLLRTKLYQKEFETNNSEENDDLDVTLDNASNLNSILVKFENTSNLFDELMEDTYHESPFKRPLCGKSPDRIPCLSSESDWSLLDDLKILIDRASNQLNAICATEMIDSYTTNQNNFSNTGYMIQNGSEKEHKEERNVNKIGYDVNSLDLGNSDGIPSPGSLSPETLRLHINAQLKLLRIHIARSQNILISLQSNSMPLLVKSSLNSPIEPYSSTDFSSSQSHPIRTSLNRTESHNSTPSHNRTRSCPILPSETAFITKGTQTEPLNSTLTKDANTRLHEAFNHKTFATPGISITPDLTDYDLNSIIPMPRNRSSSYSEAIKHGNEESDDPRLNRHLSVLQEEEHENSDHSPSPLICRSNQVAITPPSPRLPPPPYRPPPPPSFSRCLYHSLGNVSRVPIMNTQCSTPSVEILPSDQRFTQEIRLSLPSQRQRRVTLVRQMSDPFPAEINSNEFSPSQMIACINHSMSAQKMDYGDSQHQLSYLSSDVSTPVVMRNINFLDSEISPIVVCDVTPEQRIAQASQPSTITVSDSGVDTATEKISDAEESDEEIDKTIENLKIRQRKRTSGSTGNNNPAIQRSRAIDFDFGYDDFDVTGRKDDSDVDVKKEILEGMTQVTNRRTFSPPPLGGTPEFIISTSPKSSVEIHQPSFRRKVGEIQKNRLLMPELMENSETESAKISGDSMESETEQIAPTSCDVFNPPAPCGDGPFPSLPDNFLKLLQLHKSNDKIERLSEKDVEIKFHSLLLAFRTDKFTLTNRLDLHQRQRDVAEKNIEEEVIALKENLNALSQLCNDQETREIVKRLHHHLDVLHQSTARMSSRAEVYGAVQQEDRTNRAIEVMLLYVDNLKRVQEKCTAEYEEMRRIMVENNLLSEDGSENEETRRNLRSHSMTNSSVGKQASKRRASIAALPRSASERLDGNTKFINFVNTSRSTVCNIGSRRCSLYYNLRSSFSSDQEKLVKKHAADDSLIPSSSVEHSEDEHLNRPKRLSTTRRSSKRDSVVSKNLDIVKSSSPDTENSKLSDSVFASGDKAVSDILDASNSKMDCSAGNGLESLSYGPLNWQVTGDHSEPSSENDDDLDDFDDDDDETEVSQPSNSNRFRPSNMVDTAANLLNISQLANNEHLLHGVRYTVGGILFVAAIFSLLIAFFPGSQATNSCREASSWYYSIDELFRPHLELRRRLRPPM